MSCYPLIIILINSVLLKAYRPGGYIGCFKDWEHRILEGKNRKSSTNRGDECIQYCKKDRYRYAGTENKNECFCGHKLRVNEKSFGCNLQCAGNYDELCGGTWKISVYDIGHIEEGTTSPIHTSQITERETTTTRTIIRKSTTIKRATHSKTSSITKSTYVTNTEGSNNGSTQNIANNTLQKTHYPHSGIKDESSIHIAMYVAVPIGIISLLLIILFGVYTRRRQLSIKKNRLEQISEGTGSFPNIYDNIKVSKHELSDKVIKAKVSTDVRSDDVYADTYDTYVNEGEIRHYKKEIEEIEAYNTVTKHTYNSDNTNNPYHHVTNLIKDETYSVCFGNQFLNEKSDKNNTYTHIKDTVKHTINLGNYEVGGKDNVYNNLQLKKNQHLETAESVEEVSDYDTTTVVLSNTAKQTNGISNTDIGENVYNTLQLKKKQHFETTKSVEEVSDYDNTTVALSIMIDNGDYSHTNEVALEYFIGMNRSFEGDNIYYNDNEYASVESKFKKYEFETGT